LHLTCYPDDANGQKKGVIGSAAENDTAVTLKYGKVTSALIESAYNAGRGTC